MRWNSGLHVLGGASVVVGIALGGATWVLLGPSQAFTERFAVTFQDGGTMDLRLLPGFTKEGLTKPPNADQTAGPLWNRGVVTINGPFDDQPITTEHAERLPVSLRNAAVAGLIAFVGIALFGRLVRRRRLST